MSLSSLLEHSIPASPDGSMERQKKRSMRQLLAIVSIIASAVCFGQNSLPPIKWRTVSEGLQSSITRAERRFLHTSGDLQKWWKDSGGGTSSAPPFKVDFNKEFAVAVHAGQRNTGGFSVYVESVYRTTPASAVIAITEKVPGKGASVTEALTQPWVLIAIERPGVTDWQFKTRAIEWNPGGSTGLGCGCRCGKCKAVGDLTIWDPAPKGIFSVDNSFGVRTLGKVPFVPFESGFDSGIRRTEAHVIQDERAFEDYWARHRPEDRFAPPSTMDWRKEQILAIHLGNMPTTGFSVEILGIDRAWYGRMTVIYGVRSPEPETRVRRIITSPFASVRMSRITEPIDFVRRDDLLKFGCGCCSDCGRR